MQSLKMKNILGFYADNKRLGDKQLKHKKKYFETGPRLVTPPNPITLVFLSKWMPLFRVTHKHKRRGQNKQRGKVLYGITPPDFCFFGFCQECKVEKS